MPSAGLSAEARQLDRLAKILSRAYPIPAEAARLMLLQIIGGRAGRTLVTRSTDGIACAQGFDLAIVGGEGAMIHGAQMGLLDSSLGEVQEARNRQAVADLSAGKTVIDFQEGVAA